MGEQREGRGDGSAESGRDRRVVTGLPIDAFPKRVVANEAPEESTGSPSSRDPARGAMDARVGRVDPAGGEVYSPDGVVGADEEALERDRARAPSIFLAAPGMMGLLFAGMSDRVAGPGGSAIAAIIVATIASLIAAGCFLVLAKTAETSEGRMLWLLGVLGAAGLLMRAIVFSI